jgi:hypothetical protein
VFVICDCWDVCFCCCWCCAVSCFVLVYLCFNLSFFVCVCMFSCFCYLPLGFWLITLIDNNLIIIIIIIINVRIQCTLHLSDVTSKFFVLSPSFQLISYEISQFQLQWFIIYAAKAKGKLNFCKAAMLLFCISHNYYLNKFCMFLQDFLLFMISGSKRT